MTYMTPEEARTILDGWGVAGPEWCPDDMREHNERTTYETIAAMRTEYCVQHQAIPGGRFIKCTRWGEDANVLNDRMTLAENERIATRYVLDPEGDQ